MSKPASNSSSKLKDLFHKINLYTSSYHKGQVPTYPSYEAVRGIIIKSIAPFKKASRTGYVFKSKDPEGSGTTQTTHVYSRAGASKVSTCSDPMISCTCGHWIFTCEAAMYKRGFAELLRANDEDAPVTNPNKRVVMCKHAARAVDYILKKKL